MTFPIHYELSENQIPPPSSNIQEPHPIRVKKNFVINSDEETLKMLTALIDLKRVFGLFVENVQEPVAWILIYGLVNPNRARGLNQPPRWLFLHEKVVWRSQIL